MLTPSFTFGPDYPASLTDIDGTSVPLVAEQRWARLFRHPANKMIFWIPRFLDGSATMTFAELEPLWSAWSVEERQAFSRASPWLSKQADFADMLRLMVREGDAKVWSSIALSAASALPQDEAFRILCDALAATALADGANILHGIAATRHPAASQTIRMQLDRLLSTPGLWNAGSYPNRLASTAVFGIKNLLELGTEPAACEPSVRALAGHPDPATRKTCGHLVRWYPWLSDSEP